MYTDLHHQEPSMNQGRDNIANEDANHFVELASSKTRELIRIELKDVTESSTGGSPGWHAANRHLLLGNPGTGKTSITRSFTYGWAIRAMGRHYERIFVLFVRDFIETNFDNSCSRKMKNLSAAIANGCFVKREYSDDAYDSLKQRIDDALHLKSTLLILDGVDEGNEMGLSMVQKAFECECHVLFTSRPYNLRDIRSKVGTEMECVGLSDAQLEGYIRREITDGADDLIEHLRSMKLTWDMVHCPINASILCCLWQEGKETFGIGRVTRNICSLHLYERAAEFLWERFLSKHGIVAKQFPGRDVVFDSLERIAFHAREKGEILISQSLVRKHAPDGVANGVLRQSGFLLLQLEGTNYQFPHLSFQEFFAGTYLAKALFCSNDRVKTAAKTLIAKNKYNGVHRNTLWFMEQRAIMEHGDVAIEETLAIMDESPRDVIGVRHIFHKLFLIEIYLLIKNKVSHVRSPQIIKSVIQTISKLLINVHLSNGLMHLVEIYIHLPNVLRCFPNPIIDLFDATVSRLTDRHVLSMDTMTDVMTLMVELYGCQPIQQRIEDLMLSLWRSHDDLRVFILEQLPAFLKHSHFPEFVVALVAEGLTSSDGRTNKESFLCIKNCNRFLKETNRLWWTSCITACLHGSNLVRTQGFDICKRLQDGDGDALWDMRNFDLETWDGTLLPFFDKGFKSNDDGIRSGAIRACLICSAVLSRAKREDANFLKSIRDATLIGLQDPSRRVRTSTAFQLRHLIVNGDEVHARLVWKLLPQAAYREMDTHQRADFLDIVKRCSQKALVDPDVVRELVKIDEKDVASVHSLEELLGKRDDVTVIVSDPCQAIKDHVKEDQKPKSKDAIGLLKCRRCCKDDAAEISDECLTRVPKASQIDDSADARLAGGRTEDEIDTDYVICQHEIWQQAHNDETDCATGSVSAEGGFRSNVQDDERCPKTVASDVADCTNSFKSTMQRFLLGDSFYLPFEMIDMIKSIRQAVLLMEGVIQEVVLGDGEFKNIRTQAHNLVDQMFIYVPSFCTTRVLELARTETRFCFQFLLEKFPVTLLFDHMLEYPKKMTNDELRGRLCEIVVTVDLTPVDGKCSAIIYEEDSVVQYAKSFTEMKYLVYVLESLFPEVHIA